MRHVGHLSRIGKYFVQAGKSKVQFKQRYLSGFFKTQFSSRITRKYRRLERLLITLNTGVTGIELLVSVRLSNNAAPAADVIIMNHGPIQ